MLVEYGRHGWIFWLRIDGKRLRRFWLLDLRRTSGRFLKAWA